MCVCVCVTGRYTCMATNAMGQASSQAQLSVEPDEPVDETSYVSPDTLRRLMIRSVTKC